MSQSIQQAYHCKMMSIRGVQVEARVSPGTCPVCQGHRWLVQKTVLRGGRTLAHGHFEVSESVLECGKGCRHPTGGRVTVRALSDRLLPGRSVGYDVMVEMGMQRYVHQRQRREIRSTLASEDGIHLSTGEISELGRLFLDYLGRLHRDRSDALREALASDGGWPMHVDATGEDGRGTLFVTRAGWREWVLGAWKLSTERSELIEPCLRETIALFGAPVAVMRDLGRAVSPAVDRVVAELDAPIPVLACHQHLLADVGGDLLGPSYGQLRGLFRHVKVRPRLRTLVRDIGRRIGNEIDEARHDVKQWQLLEGHSIEQGRAGMAEVRALAQWVLDYKADAGKLDYPFARPYLDLYDRCTKVLRATDAYLRTLLPDKAVVRLLERLHGILEPVDSEVPFRQITRRLRQRAELFDELRDTLRLANLTSDETPEQIESIKDQLDKLVLSLQERRPQRGPAEDMREAIDLVLEHIDNHGPYLWGHEVSLSTGGTRLVARTNIQMEGFFHTMKHGERRRSGRKVLTQDFENLPAEAALAYNLLHHDYVSIVCGSLDQLPAAFARLDREQRARIDAGQPPIERQHEDLLQVATASLSTADRRTVRTQAMDKKVESAARSRAPRRSSKRAARRRATGS